MRSTDRAVLVLQGAGIHAALLSDARRGGVGGTDQAASTVRRVLAPYRPTRLLLRLLLYILH